MVFSVSYLGPDSVTLTVKDIVHEKTMESQTTSLAA